MIIIIMFIFGESSIKGFATMLIITVIITMFTMVWLTRVLLKLFVKTNYFNDKTSLFINVKSSDIPDVSKNEKVKVIPFKGFNFFKYTKPFIALSIVVIVAGIISLGVRGINLGVEYQAGSDISIATNKDVTKKELARDLDKLGLGNESIMINDDEVSIRISDVLDGDKVDEVTSYFEEKYDAKTNIGVISNVVKQELVKNAILSVVIALIGIILYISVRFKFSYAVGGVISLFHDVLIVCALFAVFHLEVSSMFIEAILTIIGYSINDTIVTFYRIREELSKIDYKKLTKQEVWSVSNRSVCETFVRSLHTFITTLIPLLISVTNSVCSPCIFILITLFPFASVITSYVDI